jgi:DNA end-binding protein Ku
VDQSHAATRIRIRPHDPGRAGRLEKEEVVKGYECGQFVTCTAPNVESSKVIDLEKFIPRGELDPVYLSSPYYIYPDGLIAVEVFRVIGAAMAEASVVGIECLT